MADYDVQRTLWTNPAAAEGMWNAAQRCWELSSSTFAVVQERTSAYQYRLEDTADRIDEVQARIDQLPIDSPERPALEAEKARLQLELAAYQEKKNNLSGLSGVGLMWKGNVDKRDVLAILENCLVRRTLMHDAPKQIRRDPDYGTVSGAIPVLSASQTTVQKWCAVQDEDGNWIARRQKVHPLVEGLQTVTSQIPLLSTSLIDPTLSNWVQGANVFPPLDTHVVQSYGQWQIEFFSPWTALCALTMPADMNADAMVTRMVGTAQGGYAVGLSARNNGWFWPAQTSLWLDNEKAFDGKISDLQFIGNSDLLETAGWGGNGQWISGLTDLADHTSRLTASTGVDFQKAYAEWYNLRSRYIGTANTGSQPQIFIVNNYYDTSFISGWDTNFRRLGEFDYDTGEPISSFWGIFQPETPAVWPRDRENNIARTSPNSMDIYTSYWNLSKMDYVAHWIPYNQAQMRFQITGNAYVETPGGRTTHNIALSDDLSGIPDFQWMFSWGNLNWENFETYAFDPYTELTRKKNDSGWQVEEGCRFRGKAVGNWAELSGSYDHATCWYWNDMFDRYGDVLGAWYIVPVAGYSAAWKEWYDSEELKTMVRFSDLDVKISLFAVRADTAQDQTTKSWRAYMGNGFWWRINNQITWENYMPPAPPAPEFPGGDDPTRPTNYSLRSCKCLGPTMLVVKYRWKTAGDDDGVHYIPLDMPAPEYTWQKPWENTEDGNGS